MLALTRPNTEYRYVRGLIFDLYLSISARGLIFLSLLAVLPMEDLVPLDAVSSADVELHPCSLCGPLLDTFAAAAKRAAISRREASTLLYGTPFVGADAALRSRDSCTPPSSSVQLTETLLGAISKLATLQGHAQVQGDAAALARLACLFEFPQK
jgi:hypothetical protein